MERKVIALAKEKSNLQRKIDQVLWTRVLKLCLKMVEISAKLSRKVAKRVYTSPQHREAALQSMLEGRVLPSGRVSEIKRTDAAIKVTENFLKIQESFEKLKAGQISKWDLIYSIIDLTAEIGIQHVIGWYIIPAGEGRCIPDEVMNGYRDIMIRFGHFNDLRIHDTIASLNEKVSGTFDKNVADQRIFRRVVYDIMKDEISSVLPKTARYHLDIYHSEFVFGINSTQESIEQALRDKCTASQIQTAISIWKRMTQKFWTPYLQETETSTGYIPDVEDRIKHELKGNIHDYLLERFIDDYRFMCKAHKPRDVLAILKFANGPEVREDTVVLWGESIASQIIEEGIVEVQDNVSVLNMVVNTGNSYLIPDAVAKNNVFEQIQDQPKIKILKLIQYLGYAIVPILKDTKNTKLYYQPKLKLRDFQPFFESSLYAEKFFSWLSDRGYLRDDRVINHGIQVKTIIDPFITTFDAGMYTRYEELLKFMTEMYELDCGQLIEKFMNSDKHAAPEVRGAAHLLLEENNVQDMDLLKYLIHQAVSFLNIGMQGLDGVLNEQSLEDAMRQSQEETMALMEDAKTFLGEAYFEMYKRAKEGGGEPFVKGELAKRTISFLDIKGFTTISKIFKDHGYVGELFDFLNIFYGSIAPIVKQHAGSIDKYEGDAVMAISEPDPGIIDVYLKIKDAILMLNEEINTGNVSLEKLSMFDTKQGRLYSEMVQRVHQAITVIQKQDESFSAGYEIRMGAQIGNVMMGSIGSWDRHNITCIGSAANEASRFEDLGRYYGYYGFIFGQELMDKINQQGRNDLVIKRLHPVVPIGSNEPIPIYTVVGYGKRLSEEMIEEVDLHNNAVHHLLSKVKDCYKKALKDFMSIQSLNPGEPLSLFYIDKLKIILRIPKLFDAFWIKLAQGHYRSGALIIKEILNYRNDPDNELAGLIDDYTKRSDLDQEGEFINRERYEILQVYLPRMFETLRRIRTALDRNDDTTYQKESETLEKISAEFLQCDSAGQAIVDYFQFVDQEDFSIHFKNMSRFFYPSKK